MYYLWEGVGATAVVFVWFTILVYFNFDLILMSVDVEICQNVAYQCSNCVLLQVDCSHHTSRTHA